LRSGVVNVTEDRALFCDGKHQKMQGFMEVCMLLLLYQESRHGYGLIEHLAFFGFSEEQLNISTLYKTLRKMELEGSVASCWEVGGQGPKKRVYNITNVGKNELENWVQILKVRKTRIEMLLDKYEETTKPAAVTNRNCD
jgi:PadR family transcriptional regulator PadR